MKIPLLGLFLLCTLACSGGTAPSTAPAPTGASPAASPAASPTASPTANLAPTPDIPYYYTREITNADLDGQSLKSLSLMRNTIYARAGNPFRKRWLHDYFATQPWYVPAVQMDMGKLSALDLKNAEIITIYETNLSKATLIQRRDAAVAAAKAGKGDDVEIVLLARALGENAWDYGIEGMEETNQEMEVTPFDAPRMLDQLLTVDALKDLSRRDLRILRNMIYARYGRSFKSELLQSYFDRMNWYKVNPAYNDGLLTDIDKRNAQIILSVENSLGGPLSDDAHKAEEGWFTGA